MSIASIEGIAKHFGVQRFSFGEFWSPTLQLWRILESNASALGLILVNPDQN